VPSIAALNPEVEPELEAVVRKSLAREPNDRYQSAADLGDALTQYLFSHRMKVSSRDIATLVRDAQVEMMRKRSAEPKESLIDALIKDEMNKMTSLVGEGGEEADAPVEGEGALDPRTFVDTAGWAGEMGLQSSGQSAPAPVKKPTKPPANKPRTMPSTPAITSGGEVESLEQMLEPDRTRMHGKKAEKATPWLLIIIVMLVLAAGAAVAVIFAMT
jgi:serine/threonine-protein kinase